MRGLLGSDFAWAVGIEDTAIGVPLRDGGRRLDEYELTGHYERFREDLDIAASLGCSAIRYGIPWYRVNPAPGRWDWRWADEALEHAVVRAGLTVIVDMVHYGVPAWLPDAFVDPGYPDAAAAFGEALATRYGDLVGHWTPLNEPLVTASFCGERAVWPPYLTGDRGWVSVVAGAVEGMQAAMAAIRAVQPDAVIAHVEAAHLWSSHDPELAEEVAHRRLRNHLPTDLLLGRVDVLHPLHDWLEAHGLGQERLAGLRAGAHTPDLIGVNYYPELSCRELVRHRDEVVGVAVDGGAAGLELALQEVHARYGLPLWVSETGIDDGPSGHGPWLAASVRAVARLRAAGLPIAGYTWWPLYDFVDWSWASAGRVVEEFHVRRGAAIEAVLPPAPPDAEPAAYLRRMGLYRLESELARQPTAAAAGFRRLAAAPPPGDLGDADPMTRQP